jgi:hypothetical protein
MTTLRAQLAEAEAQAAALRQRIAVSDCSVAGHDMHSIGGANAGCDVDCCCSVPVHECRRCGDSDYGDNAEADAIRASCAPLNSSSTMPLDDRGAVDSNPASALER